ncbi:YciI family protein [Dactylosporangium sp. NPDC048998]|uniref:YciI family protein n=1 Tax=Dactylosporangium sp. NPDC048998 TaxID=3363976 RepID=UPI00371A2C5A
MIWYLVMRRRSEPLFPGPDVLDRHLAWMRTQHEHGTVLISGPTPDNSTGIYVVRAASREEAATVANSDPMCADGKATIEIIEWDVHQVLGVGGFDLASLSAITAARHQPTPEEGI